MTRQRIQSIRKKVPQPSHGFLRRWCGCLCLFSLFFSAGCFDSLPGKPTEADRYKRPDTIMDSSTLYKTNCSGCHGADGTMGPAPPLNDPLFLAICSDADIKQIVMHGRDHTPMPAMDHKTSGPLTEKQIDAIVAGIRAEWGKTPPQLSPPFPPYKISDPPGSTQAGKKVFSQYCATCHGKDGQGDTAGALNDAGFLGTISNQALRRIIITGRSDLGMPNYHAISNDSLEGKPLTSQQITDLVALLAEWRTADVGGNE
ncbi:Cbb3-type cytochrome c oxidase subunit CcoP2 [Symmachiella macrocystis]|uniref:Cbb3-type cytochrome c oxidase subunit CcoP2 n=1 Tax=Symmachiella macrocystis TaxID=2527985 RepID=A0A5C6BMW0_9PLAN|nr:c-type cytochrome [Symmachiella macrocystis]TWU13483.1 Cbb3-type cytochrome c oxidase subunit CcoP2 [Symmachiella macrocystis]